RIRLAPGKGWERQLHVSGRPHSTRESDRRRPTSQEAGGVGATLTGDRSNTKGKRPGEEMRRTNAVVIALATELTATGTDAARLPFEIQAPRNQDVRAPRACGEKRRKLAGAPTGGPMAVAFAS